MTIDGQENVIKGQIIIDGDGRYKGTETLTLENIKFEGSKSDFYSGTDAFILIPNTKETNKPYSTDKYNYAHNITITNCSFTSTSDSYDVVGMKVTSGAGAYNLVLNEVEGNNLHSLAQVMGTTGATIENCKVNGGESFVNVDGGTGDFIIKNNEFTSAEGADGYGLRLKGNSSANITLEDNNFSAVTAVVLGKNNDAPSGTINIVSGTYTGAIAKNTTDASTGKYAISGGTYSVRVSDEYLAEGFILHDNGDGTFTVQEGSYLARIGENKYETLEDAFAAAEDGDTITLLADGSGNGIVVPQDKFAEGLTVDFRGFAYTINGGTLAGSTGTKTQAFQLLKGNKITFQNGAIVADNKDVKVLIQNYSDLTLDSMTLDATQGTNNIGYVLSTNNGKTVINNTTITAKKDGVAFDACSGWGGYTSNAVEVTGTSVINGNVEVSYYGQEGTDPASLTLTSGTLNGSIVMEKGADKCTITKADDFEAEAPNGYKWEKYGENTYKLVVNVGDVNRDGKVDSADVQAIVNIILDMVPEDADYNREAADVDGDDRISISDVTALIKQIIGE